MTTAPIEQSVHHELMKTLANKGVFKAIAPIEDIGIDSTELAQADPFIGKVMNSDPPRYYLTKDGEQYIHAYFLEIVEELEAEHKAMVQEAMQMIAEAGFRKSADIINQRNFRFKIDLVEAHPYVCYQSNPDVFYLTLEGESYIHKHFPLPQGTLSRLALVKEIWKEAVRKGESGEISLPGGSTFYFSPTYSDYADDARFIETIVGKDGDKATRSYIHAEWARFLMENSEWKEGQKELRNAERWTKEKIVELRSHDMATLRKHGYNFKLLVSAGCESDGAIWYLTEVSEPEY